MYLDPGPEFYTNLDPNPALNLDPDPTKPFHTVAL